MKILRKLIVFVVVVYAALLAVSGLLGVGGGRLKTVGCLLMVAGAALLISALIRLLKKKPDSAHTAGIGFALSWTGTCLVGMAGEFNILHHVGRLAVNALLFYAFTRVQPTKAEIDYAAKHQQPSKLLAPFRRLRQVPGNAAEKKNSNKKASHKRK